MPAQLHCMGWLTAEQGTANVSMEKHHLAAGEERLSLRRLTSITTQFPFTLKWKNYTIPSHIIVRRRTHNCVLPCKTESCLSYFSRKHAPMRNHILSFELFLDMLHGEVSRTDEPLALVHQRTIVTFVSINDSGNDFKIQSLVLAGCPHSHCEKKWKGK